MKRQLCIAGIGLALACIPARGQTAQPKAVSGSLLLESIGIIYELDYQGRAGSFDVSGVRVVGELETPITGTAFVRSDGAIVFGWTEHFDWTLGQWSHPIGTTMAVFPSGLGSPGTRETTYHGGDQAETHVETIAVATKLAEKVAELPGRAENVAK